MNLKEEESAAVNGDNGGSGEALQSGNSEEGGRPHLF